MELLGALLAGWIATGIFISAVLIIMIWISGCVLCVRYARHKGYSEIINILYGLVAVLLSPLFILFIIFLSKDVSRICPNCKEKIKEKATICKHCQTKFREW